MVDLQGGALVSAGAGIGLDTSLSSASSSDFAQEIVTRAVERVRSSTVDRRLSRSLSKYETSNLHEINNVNGESMNGVYCFLDKHVRIREKPYGHRIFLLANVLMPGKNLLCESVSRKRIDLHESAPRPDFDITPNDIHPGNYKELVGRFRAQNVEPPPSPTLTIGRTYKTDTTSKSQPDEFKGQKIADLLVPLFQRYGRYLITDDVKIPDGYMVRDVYVTVNHGSNGISFPAHLPLSLAGAAGFSHRSRSSVGSSTRY